MPIPTELLEQTRNETFFHIFERERKREKEREREREWRGGCSNGTVQIIKAMHSVVRFLKN